MTLFDIRNIKVSHAILIMPMLPLLVALVFSAVLISDKLTEVRQLDKLTQLTNPITLISQAVHEQQKERGATAVYLSSEGKEFKRELGEQRKLTDGRHDDILQFLAQNDLSAIDAAFWENLSAYKVKFQELGKLRSDVDGLKVTPAKAIGFYTNLNTDMLDLVQTVALLSDDKEVSEVTAGFVDFLKGKEKSGIERAVGSGGFAAGQFTFAQAARLKGLIAAQDVNFANFLFTARTEEKTAFNAMLKSASVQEVEKLREIALSTGIEGELKGYTGADFFAAQTKRINQLKDIENLISEGLQSMVAAKRAAANTSLYSFLVGVLVAGGLALMISVYFARFIRKGFKEVISTAQNLADGNLETDIPKVQDNEFGDVMATLEVFRDNSLQRREMAQREGKEREERAQMAKREQEREAEIARQEAERERAIAKEREAQHEREAQIAREIAGVVAACAKGEFDQRLELEGKEGVFAEIGAGLNQVCEVTEDGLNQVRRALELLAEGDLTFEMSGDFEGVFGAIQSQVNKSISSLSESFARVRDSGSMINGSTQEIAGAAQDLAIRTERAAATLEETATAIKTLSTSVESTADLASEANITANSVNDEVHAGNELVQRTVSAIREVQQSSGAIGAAIRLIDDITFQTNLLALNAGVEAARAGDAGRGFAVVASEVRDLAARSADAAKEISELVKRSETEVDHGVSLVVQTGDALQSISESVSGIVGRIEEIANSAADQSSNIKEITVATDQLDQVTQQNAAMFEEASASSVSLRVETENLEAVIANFKIAEGAQADGSLQPAQEVA